MLGTVASVLDVGLFVILCGVFCRRRVGLVGGLLPDLHSLDIHERLAGAISPGMIFGDRVIVSYSQLGQVFWLCTNKSLSPQSEKALGWGVIL